MNRRELIHLCGTVAMSGSIFFSMSVLILGLVQPGYNHIIDTISVLVLGKFGWVQNGNFVILSLSIGTLGIGLGLTYYKTVWNNITNGFIFLSLCLLLDVVFKADPIDRTQVRLTSSHSTEGLIHLTITFLMIIIIPIIFINLIRKLKSTISTYKLGVYTSLVIGINLISGLLWYYCRYVGIGFEVKGLWQKGIVLNVLIWIIIMGNWLSQRNL